MQFKVRRILAKDIQKEIEKIGFCPSYVDFGALKHKFLNIKIYDLKPPAASIIKQTALSLGADAAVHRGVLDCSVEKSDVILSGSAETLKNVAEKLRKQQFSLPLLADEITKQIEIYKKNYPVNKEGGAFCGGRPKIAGILNITENSFSDGGKFLDPKRAIEHAYRMIEDGADIIDIGAESTAPNAFAVPAEVEIQRIEPVVAELKNNSGCTGVKISIDTRNSLTARKMADLGADIINDVSGLTFDDNMAKTIAQTGLEVVITHSRGTPENMDTLCDYKNTVDEIYFELYDRVQKAIERGIQEKNIIADPGFGFAKNIEQNFEILSKIEEFKSMGFRVFAGVSRKRFLKSLITKGDEPDKPDEITAGVSLYLALRGINIIRVHNVTKTRLMLDLAEKIISSGF